MTAMMRLYPEEWTMTLCLIMKKRWIIFSRVGRLTQVKPSNNMRLRNVSVFFFFFCGGNQSNCLGIIFLHFAQYFFDKITGTALRYIAAEFPNVPLDEKLIDLYAVATFFFSTGGTFWTNNTKWKSGDSVCIWHGIGCDEEGHVISISLANNYLRGKLPPELGLLAPRQVQGNKTISGLTKLDLSYNNIKETIPEEVALLTSMEEFSVDGNELWGNIPVGISSWTGLEYASFTENNLEGEIPDGVCEQTDVPQIAVDCAKVKCSCCTPSCFSDQEVSDPNRGAATASPSPSDD